MSWMDLSDYLVIEDTAAARIDDLREEAASDASVEMPAPAHAAARPVRVWACDCLRPASAEAP